MAHIRTITPKDAEAELRRLYDEAKARAGKVYQIVRLMSLNPETLRASMGLYLATTVSPRSALPRWVREAIAVVVSVANHCVY
jgi:alkylhydroperoxidase family enzyme